MTKTSTRRTAVAAVAAFAAAAGTPAVQAAPCVGFTDVDSTASYCRNVEWLKNRAVTLGCTATTYCPTDSVTRAQMAIFMNRLGTALTTQRLVVDAAPGAVVLPAGDPIRVCETATLPAAVYPRAGVLRAAVSGLGNANASAWAATPLLSLDGGTTWIPLEGATIRASSAAGAWSTASPVAGGPLPTGTAMRFAIGLRRDDIAAATTGNLADSRCQLVVEVDNANGTVSPYDVAADGGAQ